MADHSPPAGGQADPSQAGGANVPEWMRLGRQLAAVAVAEMRSARRLARTWVFCGITFLTGALSWFVYSAMHGLLSGLSGSFGIVNPRFIMSSQGVMLLLMFIVALVFLAFDVRARDTRERMAEVLDSRPVGNLTMLAGRLLGLVAVVWAPLLLLACFTQGVGALAKALDWPVGEAVEPISLLSLLLVDAPTTLFLWGSVVTLLATTLRYRLAVAVAGLALLAGWAWATWTLPVYLTPALTGLSSSQPASDLLPRFTTPMLLAQRVATVFVAVGLLVLAAALHPRQGAGRRAHQFAGGGALAALGAAIIGALVVIAQADMNERNAWLAHHQAHAQAPRVDVQHIAGEVRIDPGRFLDFELSYTLKVPDAASIAHLTFSLNPSMTVREARLDDQADTRFEHDRGLLVVPLPAGVSPSQTVTLTVSAFGVPDPNFAYLDSALDMLRLSADAGPLVLLGTDAAVYHSDYVALMPGNFWMPVPGAAVDGGGRLGADHFTVDLRVEAPSDWLVAGPGRREGADGRFRFRPEAPVPMVGLLAAAFTRQAARFANVEVELLLAPEHAGSADIFQDMAEPLGARLTELFEAADSLGLPYPYEALSAVEVPAHLRTYGGGWRMASVQALPGVVLLREYGLPTARFAFHLDDLDEQERADEEDTDRVKVGVLERFFHDDITGGNPLHGAVRNVLAFQTSARGPGAAALDFVLHDLAVQIITGKRSGFFSPHSLGGQADLNSLIGASLNTFIGGRGGGIGGSVYTAATRSPAVWDTALGTPLGQLDTSDAKRATNVLWLKGPEIAQIMLDGLGRERAAAVLAEVRRRHAGGNYTVADLNAAAATAGADLPNLLGDWLDDSALPGFLVSPISAARLPDDERGAPRYQLGVHVRNDEPVPGLVRLSYAQESNAGWIRDRTAPIRVPAGGAVEVGMVAAALPEQIHFHPYLALNRRGIALPVAAPPSGIVDAEPFNGARPSDWKPNRDDGIYVDDLDPRFTVEYDDPEAQSDHAWGAPEIELDQGLPVHDLFGSISGWSRQETPQAWGKYRRTVARSPAGVGDSRAVFAAELPAAGRWRLEYHIPALERSELRVEIGTDGASASASPRVMHGLGGYDLKLHTGGEVRELEFDAAAAEVGWNRIGDFALAAGEVRLALSNDTAGRLVVADAIRWLPLAGTGTE